MSVKWIQTKYPGVRCREHATRKHGPGPDRYFVIRHTFGGRTLEEAVGWASGGVSAAQAAQVLAEIKLNQRTGSGPCSLAEMRDLANRERAAAATAASERAHIPENWDDLAARYLVWARLNKTTWADDERIIRLRLGRLSGMRLRDITHDILDAIRGDLETTYAPASVVHSLGLVRRIWNWGQDRYGMAWSAQLPANPGERYTMPRVNNRRMRYLTYDESETLLAAAAEIDPQTHDIAYLALYTGMRRNEIACCRVGHVDRLAGVVHILSPKSGAEVETVECPGHVLAVLRPWLDDRPPEALLFPSRGTGGKNHNISSRFRSVVDTTSLNDGIDDPRYRVTFHTLRHTFVSWLVIAGVNLATVKEMARHRSFDMTLRYAHLQPSGKKDAASLLPIPGSRGRVVQFPASANGDSKS